MASLAWHLLYTANALCSTYRPMSCPIPCVASHTLCRVPYLDHRIWRYAEPWEVLSRASNTTVSANRQHFQHSGNQDRCSCMWHSVVHSFRHRCLPSLETSDPRSFYSTHQPRQTQVRPSAHHASSAFCPLSQLGFLPIMPAQHVSFDQVFNPSCQLGLWPVMPAMTGSCALHAD